MKSKHAAILTIHHAPSMTKRGRTAIAAWLRRQAGFLEKEAKNLSHRFTARYLYSVILLVAVLSLTGCGKTITELRADGGAIVDNGSSLIKKVLDAGVAVYDIVKKVMEDSKDNVNAVKEVVSPTVPNK